MPGSIDYKKIRSIVKEESEIASHSIQVDVISKVAKEASKEAVTEILTTCGVDVTDPFEMQKLMAYARECKKNAQKTSEAVNYVHDHMETGKIFKVSLIKETAKHGFTMAATLIIFWFSSVKGLFTYGG